MTNNPVGNLSEAESDPLGTSPARARTAASSGAQAGRGTAAQFRRRHYPQITQSQWNDWKWQVANRIATRSQVERILDLSEDERAAIGADGRLPFAVTPYYASLLDPADPTQPLRRTVIPTILEQSRNAGEAEDPLDEEGDMAVPGVVHRYPDRVLFLVTDLCSTYCRYCTRSRLVGAGHSAVGETQWNRGLDYIAEHPEIRDVLISGGDPLLLSDEKLEWLLARLRRIEHVQIIRIGTKVPAVLPMRVTAKLTSILRRYHPLFMSLHFTHPDELSDASNEACRRLADAGIPLGSQTVLLRGVNDSLPVMRDLVHRLLMARVRPYYLYQCDPIIGSAHFRTRVEAGIEIIRGLRGHTTGYAVPTFVIDAPGGGGKIPVMPDYTVGTDCGSVLLRNYEGRTFAYPDGCGGEIL